MPRRYIAFPSPKEKRSVSRLGIYRRAGPAPTSLVHTSIAHASTPRLSRWLASFRHGRSANAFLVSTAITAITACERAISCQQARQTTRQTSTNFAGKGSPRERSSEKVASHDYRDFRHPFPRARPLLPLAAAVAGKGGKKRVITTVMAS